MNRLSSIFLIIFLVSIAFECIECDCRLSIDDQSNETTSDEEDGGCECKIVCGVKTNERKSCGLSEPKHFTNETESAAVDYIIGGRKAYPGEYPWQVYIKTYYNANTQKHRICGGTIWNSKYVLTAGHCLTECNNGKMVKPVKVEVCRSELDTKQKDGEKCFEVSQWSPHEDYDQCKNRIENDIGMIRFPQKVKIPNLTERGYGSTNAACHPKPVSYKGVGVVSGWGIVDWDKKNEASAQLKTVQLPIWTNEKCRKYYAPKNKTIDDSHICAGGDINQNVCMGDSGSGLLWYDTYRGRNRGHVIGIVSFSGFPCASEGMPAIFTRVSHFLPWIQTTITDLND